MATECRYQEEIARLLFEDFEPQAQAELEGHLESCLICRREWERCRQTLSRLREWEDVAPPRHFGIGPPASARGRMLSPVWKGLIAASFLAVAVMIGLLFSAVQVSAQSGGGVILSWGVEPPPSLEQVLASEPFRQQLSQLLEEQLAGRTAEITGLLRAEIEESQSGWTQQQRQALNAGLASLESRLFNRLSPQVLDLEAGLERTNWTVQALSTRQQKGFKLINDRIDLVAVGGAIQGSQNDFLLTTLLEMADRRLGAPPGGPTR